MGSKRRRPPHAAGLAVLLSLTGIGCGRDEADGGAAAASDPVPSQTAPPVPADELVPLRPKRLERSDRPPTPAPVIAGDEDGTGVTPVTVPAGNSDLLAAIVAPGADWESEALGAAAAARLAELAEAASVDEVAAIVAPDARTGRWTTEGMSGSVHNDGLLVIADSQGDSPGRIHADSPEAGPEGFWTELVRLRGDDAPATAPLRFKFKIVGVEVESTEAFRTRILVEGHDAARRRQANAEWTCRWTREGEGPPMLADLRAERFEQILAPGGPLFADATSAVLGDTPHFDSQVRRGIEFWARRITRLGDLFLTGHHGLAIGDVDGDGRDDLFVCDGGSLPNRLYRQRRDGTAEDITVQAGLDWLEDSRGALLVDLDNDGDQDLVVGTIAMIAFAENDGTGRFTLRGGHPGPTSPFSLSAADYDLDGDLDLFVCRYGAGDDAVSGRRGFEARSPIPFQDAENGGRNILLENLGDFRFADTTSAAGLDVNNTRWSFAAAWEDFDRDGDPDLYVANDFGRNCLYRNDPGPDGRRRFTEIAAEAGVEDRAAGMSVAWGDPNGDGWPDLYVGNMFSSAGHRIAFQPAFAPGRGDAAVAGRRRMARGNSLFLARRDRTGIAFADAGEDAGAAMGRWAWSSGFADLDNDGREDLVVANGYLTNTREDDL